jgi:hypothetical protein
MLQVASMLYQINAVSNKCFTVVTSMYNILAYAPSYSTCLIRSPYFVHPYMVYEQSEKYDSVTATCSYILVSVTIPHILSVKAYQLIPFFICLPFQLGTYNRGL